MELRLTVQGQQYIYNKDFMQMEFEQLVSFVNTILQTPVFQPEFKFQNLLINNMESFDKVKADVLERNINSIELILVSQPPKHDVVCSSCKCTPIIGVRYKCHICKNTDFCMDCFPKHNHPLIMIQDPSMMLTPPSAIKLAFQKMARGIMAISTSQCQKLTEFTKKKMAEHQEKKLKAKQDEEARIQLLLLKLPLIAEQDPARYHLLVEKSYRMNLKELAKEIDL